MSTSCAWSQAMRLFEDPKADAFLLDQGAGIWETYQRLSRLNVVVFLKDPGL
jgi:hypothetical protein